MPENRGSVASKEALNVEGIFRLSPLQEGLLFHALYAPEAGIYFEQFTCLLDGPLERSAFERAWQAAIDRHEALRALFTWKHREHPLQVIRKRVVIPVTFLDASDGGTAEDLSSFLAEDRRRGFRLDEAPLLRVSVIRLAPERHRLVWSFHHLLLDGWSQRLVLREVLARYELLTRDADAAPEAAAPRYRDYLAWLAGRDTKDSERFWRDTLAGFTRVTDLRLARPPQPSADSEPFGELHLKLPAGDTAALVAMARRERVTLNTVVSGAWALLLHHYGGEPDVVFGSTTSGRPTELDGAESMVGLLINTLPVRATVDATASAGDWLRALQTTLQQMREHEHCSLADIQRWSDVEAGRPLFETLVVFESHIEPEANGLKATLTASEPRYVERSHFPLALLAVPGDSLELMLIHDRSRFADADIESLGQHVLRTLSALATKPDAGLRELPTVDGGTRDELLRWAQGTALVASEASVVELFDEAAASHPERVAVEDVSESVTYAEFERRTRGIAARLLGAGLRPDEPTAICIDRSNAMAAGIFGILRAGGAYVPIDPQWPASRRDFILDDAGARIVVTTSTVAPSLSREGRPLVTIDDAEVSASSGATLPTIDPNARAYIIYTSGSTGLAKGVEVLHRNLRASTSARFQHYSDGADRFLLLSPFTFDSSVAGIFWTLCGGGTLSLPPQRIEQDLAALAAWIHEREISHTLCLPSLYGLLLEHAPPESLASLRTVIVAGESASPALAAHHASATPRAELYNEYGPTEATVWSAVYRASSSETGASLPIGRPPPGVELYLLDAERRLVAPGLTGEIHIGGKAVARGYCGAPELTASRFGRIPLPESGASRVYRTGDLARHRRDGNLEFLGRVDQQVKIRGHRVEVEEIEAVLRSHPDVMDAAVRPFAVTPGSDAPKDPGESLAARLVALGADSAERLLRDIESDDGPQPSAERE